MKRIAIRALAPTLSGFFVALALCLPQPSPVVAQDQEVQVIELTAKKYEYSLSPIHVISSAPSSSYLRATEQCLCYVIPRI